jgi:hypothetical protein
VTIAYQPVDPAADVTAMRIPLSDLAGWFLCRRVRSSFNPKALIELIEEHRSVTCECGGTFDAQILTAEPINGSNADLRRSGKCPTCGSAHTSHLQFQKNGLILSDEDGEWFIWLAPVWPNRHGNAMEEHLFWYNVDWTKQDSELAEELDVAVKVVRSWRSKLAEATPAKEPTRCTSRTSSRQSR